MNTTTTGPRHLRQDGKGDRLSWLTGRRWDAEMKRARRIGITGRHRDDRGMPRHRLGN